MLLDERAKLPRRQPVAEKVGGGDDRGGAHAVVDQRDLAEVVTPGERRAVLAPIVTSALLSAITKKPAPVDPPS